MSIIENYTIVFQYDAKANEVKLVQTKKNPFCSRCGSVLIWDVDHWICSTNCSVTAERWMQAFSLFIGPWVNSAFLCTRCRTRLLHSIDPVSNTRYWCPGCGNPRGPYAS